MYDKNRKRAIRRSHYQRLKKKVRWYYDGKYIGQGKEYSPNDDSVCGALANTQKNCSCWMCGNPRKFNNYTGEFRYTIQERKVYQESIDDILKSY